MHKTKLCLNFAQNDLYRIVLIMRTIYRIVLNMRTIYRIVLIMRTFTKHLKINKVNTMTTIVPIAWSKIFCQIISLLISLVKTSLSRNFCQKCVRVNFRNYHTVHTFTVKEFAEIYILSRVFTKNSVKSIQN